MNRWKFIASLSLFANVLLALILFLGEGSHEEEIKSWQEAARPVAVQRGLVGTNMTPRYLAQVLDEKCAVTHYEAPKLYVNGSYGYHK